MGQTSGDFRVEKGGKDNALDARRKASISKLALYKKERKIDLSLQERLLIPLANERCDTDVCVDGSTACVQLCLDESNQLCFVASQIAPSVAVVINTAMDVGANEVMMTATNVTNG